MNPILVLSILLQLFALGWSVLLLVRHRDRRVTAVTGLLALMAVQSACALARDGVGPALAEWPTLALAVVAALAILYLGWLIEERKRAHRLLEKSEEKYRKLIETTDTGFVIIDEHGRVLDANAEYTRLTGHRDLEEIRGRSVLEWTAPWHRDRNVEEIGRTFAGNLTRRLELDYLGPDGRVTPIEVNGAVLMTEDGPRVFGLCRDITARKKGQERLRESADRLRVLSRRVVEVQEEERRHLARELHDEIGQVLTSINLSLHAIKSVAPADVQPRLDECLKILGDAIGRVRNLSLDLRPSMLDLLGLEAALRWYIDRQAKQAGFTGALVGHLESAHLPPDLETTCFRVVQEALTNVARHAGAKNVRVELRQGDAELELTIHDDGVGFDVAAARERAGRGGAFGVLGMQERVELVGGRFEIESTPGQGTTIRARLPLPAESGAA